MSLGALSKTHKFFGQKNLTRLVSEPQNLVGRDVFVYRNLARDVWSLKARDGEDKGCVIGHTDRLVLDQPRFVVREAGRQRVLREGQKNVHAGIQGRVVAVGDQCDDVFDRSVGVPVTYNPYKNQTFVNAASTAPIRQADRAMLDMQPVDGQKVLATGARFGSRFAAIA